MLYIRIGKYVFKIINLLVNLFEHRGPWNYFYPVHQALNLLLEKILPSYLYYFLFLYFFYLYMCVNLYVAKISLEILRFS